MNTCICASGSDHTNLLSSHISQRFFKTILNAATLRLGLPTTKVVAIVF
jgi:hypothetical protein